MTTYTGHMAERSIPASQFKAQCLALLDEVAETRQPLVVTKRGKPVAKVVPAAGLRTMPRTVNRSPSR